MTFTEEAPSSVESEETPVAGGTEGTEGVGSVADETTTVESNAPDAPVLDLDDFSDYVVPIKVDGQEQFVPLSDAVQGSMRQADYTRKTQELAAQREAQAEAIAIAEALRTNPQETLKVLEDWFIEDGGTEPPSSEADNDLENSDPLEREVRELAAWRQSIEEQEAEAALRSELDRFNEKYGVDQEALLRFAVENNIPNLEWAYAVMETGRRQAEAQVESERQAGEQARQAAKADASVIDGGTNRASGASSVPMGTSDTVRTVEDAWRLAEQQLGPM